MRVSKRTEGESRWRWATVVIALTIVEMTSRDAVAQSCTSDDICSNGIFCDGVERCGPPGLLGMRQCMGPGSGSPPCPGQICDEAADRCETACARDVDCQDGVFCNGMERCMPGVAGADIRGCTPAANSACQIGEECLEDSDDCRVACDIPRDADGDGAENTTCGGTDCDDADPERWPGNAEDCDAHDEDCDPTTVGVRDRDSDTFNSAECCNPDPNSVGGTRCARDCNDDDPEIHPIQNETCDGRDENCNGQVDEGALRTFSEDRDGDGFAPLSPTQETACDPPAGFAESVGQGDCDDEDALIVPGAMRCGTGTTAVEVCNGGSFFPSNCDPRSESICVIQPNGLGACIPTKPLGGGVR